MNIVRNKGKRFFFEPFRKLLTADAFAANLVGPDHIGKVLVRPEYFSLFHARVRLTPELHGGRRKQDFQGPHHQ